MRAFWLVLVLAIAGLFDSVYLTVEHLNGVVPSCVLSGCETVLTSKFASIGNFPTAGLGIIYYSILILFTLLLLDRRRKMFAFLVTRFSLVGLISSLVFVFLQLVVLGAICQYCMLSAGICLVIFIICIRHWGLVFR